MGDARRPAVDRMLESSPVSSPKSTPRSPHLQTPMATMKYSSSSHSSKMWSDKPVEDEALVRPARATHARPPSLLRC